MIFFPHTFSVNYFIIHHPKGTPLAFVNHYSREIIIDIFLIPAFGFSWHRLLRRNHVIVP